MTATRTTPPETYGEPREESGWTGWIAFAGIMLLMTGLFTAIEGIVALANPNFYAVAPSGLLVTADLTVWGWVQLGLGLVAFLTGVAVLAGNAIARIVAAIIAGVSAIVHLAFIPAYPFWAIIVIVLDVIVIYALTAHGGDYRARSKTEY
ncbi:MAG TPA: hypothetical protein VFW65_31800 [Pseudonocardiaceae bacterium]|nr:hypothetical protein [Pseudonocardiaceae bacterium]